MGSFLKKVKTWLSKVRKLPLFGGMAEDLITLIDMLEDYRAGLYRSLPKGVVIAGCRIGGCTPFGKIA